MKDKNIIRVEKNKDFVVINRTVLNDKRLSWKAKGIMAYMLAMPDDWVFYLDELETHSTDGQTSFRNGFNELKKYGYTVRKRERKPNGKFEWRTIVHEVPLSDYPQVDKQRVEKRQVDNDKLLSIDELNTDKLNTDKEKDKYVVEKLDIDYKEIVDYLNEKTGKNYRHTTKKTRSDIKSRVNEGFTYEDFKKVIDNKVADWKHDNEMNKYLRPETLFGTKFEGYLNQHVKQSIMDIGYNPEVDSF